MIHDVSKTLAAILSFQEPSGDSKELKLFIEKLKKRFAYLARAVIQFESPIEGEYKPPSPHALNLFLYDIRENMELRNNEPVVTYSDRVASIQRPPMRVSCSYLVTAWPVSTGSDDEQLPAPLREQWLLGEALQVLAHFPTIPAPLLQGNLVGQEPPLPVVVAQSDGLKDPAEFWTAIKGKLRPSFTVTVTVAMPEIAEAAETVKIVTDRRVLFGERTAPDEKGITQGTLQTTETKGPFRIVGRITDVKGMPVKEAFVTIAHLGLGARSDAEGHYRLEGVPAGKQTLLVRPSWNNSELKAKEADVTVSASVETSLNVQLSKE